MKKSNILFKITPDKAPHDLPQFTGTALDDTYGATSRYLTKNGKPYICRMGEIHYSRVPEECWEDELIKMKSGGVDVISSYVFWIHHEEIEGNIRFDGNLNIKKFLSICKKLSLPFILRLGPWVHGEAKNGGFPDWLPQRTDGVLRTNDERYLSYVRRFFEKIYEEVKDYLDVILGIQLENELRREAEYVRKLKEMILDIGFHPAYFTFTGWGGSDSLESCPAGEVLCLYGGYPEAPWNQDTDCIYYNPNFTFSPERDDANIGADLLGTKHFSKEESQTLKLIQETPYLTCEMGGGNNVTYHRRPIIHPLDIYAISICKLGSGANGLGYFMYHGGQNPMGISTTMQESSVSGYPNDLPIISYDFQAPLGSCGQLRESYFYLKRLFRFIDSFREELAPMPAYFCEENMKLNKKENNFSVAVRSGKESGYIFFNNHARLKTLPHVDADVCISMPDGKEITIPLDLPSDAIGIIPFNLKVGDTTVAWLNAMPLYYEGDVLHLSKNIKTPPALSYDGKTVEPIISGMKIGGVTLILEDEYEIPKASERQIEIRPISADTKRDFYSHIINYDKTVPIFPDVDQYEFTLTSDTKYLRIRASGNIGALYLGDTLIDDYYLNGTDWIVDVRRIEKPNVLSLHILPLTIQNKEKIYFEFDMPTGTHIPKVYACTDNTIYV